MVRRKVYHVKRRNPLSNALHKKRCRNADYDPVDDDMGPQPTARK